MKRTSRITTIVALTLCLISGSGAVAQRTLKNPVPVTSIIEGSGAPPDPTIFNYRIQSDLLGPYRDSVDGVVTELQTGGDYILNALGSLNRSFLLDFRDPVPNSNANPPFSVGQSRAKVETKSYTLYGNGKVSGMTGLNSTLITPLLLRFDLPNGNTYRIWMNSQNYVNSTTKCNFELGDS